MENTDIKVVLVEPLYQINLGYAARTLKNFGVTQMNLVRPRCKHTGKEAVKYSKHAVDVLKAARIYKSIKESTRDCDIVIGTTGQWFKTGPSFTNVYDSSAMGQLIKGKRAAILIGRDDTGLTKEELRDCDATIFIPASKQYPVLNITHALAIILYETSRKGLKNTHNLDYFYAGKRSRDGVVKLFRRSIKDRKDIRDKTSVVMAFRHMVNRANPTARELSALSIGIAKPVKVKERRRRG